MRDKADLRRTVLARRTAAANAATGTDVRLAAMRLAEVLRPQAGRMVAGYLPMRDEADPRPALFHHHSGPVCLPVVMAIGQRLEFRRWNPGDPLERGSFGTQHPPATAEIVTPSVLVVPVVAFDRAGNRLGYGGGFYDRTLAALRAAGPVRAIGFAYAAQELDHVPHDATDQPLDMIVTEAEVIIPRLG